MKKLLKAKLEKFTGFSLPDALVEFVLEIGQNGLPDLKVEIKADKEKELEKIEAKRDKLLQEINEIK